MYRFIIVDDEHLIRKGILKKIEDFDLGLEFVGEAENGEDALELINKINPHIILTDMRMPVMDGKSLLKTLQQNYPEKKVIVVSGYSDFEYMQEAIAANVVGYLLKPFNRAEIHTAFEKAIALIVKEHSLQEKFNLAETEKEKTYYSMDLQVISDLILNNNKKNVLPGIKSHKLYELVNTKIFSLLSIFSVNQFILESCSSFFSESGMLESSLSIPNPSNPNIVFALLFFIEADDNFIMSKVEDKSKMLIESLGKQSDNRVFIGISEIKHELTELGQAYEESLSALDNMSIENNSNLYFYKKQSAIIERLTWDGLDQLLFFIESGNTDKVIALTENFFHFFEQQPMITLATVKFNFQNLFDRVRDILLSNFDNMTNNSFSSTYHTIIGTCFDINAVKTYFMQLLTNISGMLKEKNIYPSDEIVNNIKTYIQRNYSRDLTLEKLSSLFFIHPSYCCFLFKEKTGVNFIEYVSTVRIERAKELLKSTDYKVYKIAKTIGYTNTKYFFRLFKKVTGLTPEEYRKT